MVPSGQDFVWIHSAGGSVPESEGFILMEHGEAKGCAIGFPGKAKRLAVGIKQVAAVRSVSVDGKNLMIRRAQQTLA